MGRKKKALTKDQWAQKKDAKDVKDFKKRVNKNPSEFLKNIRKLKHALDSFYNIELNNVPMDREQHFELKRVQDIFEEVSEFLLYEPEEEE